MTGNAFILEEKVKIMCDTAFYKTAESLFRKNFGERAPLILILLYCQINSSYPFHFSCTLQILTKATGSYMENFLLDIRHGMYVFSLFSIMRILKAVCHAFDWVTMTIQRIGNLNG